MRLFVGIELGEPLAASVNSAAARLRSDLLRGCPDLPVRWVRRDNLHLTVVFLGEVHDEDAQAVATALELGVDVEPFTLRIAGFGVFPPAPPLRVIWMGIAQGGRELMLLHEEITARLRTIGHPGEARSYSPHLTIARVGDLPRSDEQAVRTVVRTATATAQATRIDSVTLFRSQLAPAGASYEALMRVPLLG